MDKVVLKKLKGRCKIVKNELPFVFAYQKECFYLFIEYQHFQATEKHLEYTVYKKILELSFEDAVRLKDLIYKEKIKPPVCTEINISNEIFYESRTCFVKNEGALGSDFFTNSYARKILTEKVIEKNFHFHRPNRICWISSLGERAFVTFVRKMQRHKQLKFNI